MVAGGVAARVRRAHRVEPEQGPKRRPSLALAARPCAAWFGGAVAGWQGKAHCATARQGVALREQSGRPWLTARRVLRAGKAPRGSELREHAGRQSTKRGKAGQAPRSPAPARPCHPRRHSLPVIPAGASCAGRSRAAPRKHEAASVRRVGRARPRRGLCISVIHAARFVWTSKRLNEIPPRGLFV